jgi:thiamine-monophosphate kinase
VSGFEDLRELHAARDSGDDRLVRDVGEFGLIALLTNALPDEVRAGANLVIGIGDDAAVWQPAPRALVVVTTDSLVEDVHFRLDWTDWESLGHKILAVNVSDLAAMGAVPRLAVVTLGLRGTERVSDLQALYRGLGDVARRNAMSIAGGDLVRSPHGLAFHVTAIGETRGGRVLARAGARTGDVVGVTGTLGASAAGLQLLAAGEDDARRRAATADMLIGAHLRPEPRVALGAALLDHGASSGMDLSDGLLGDLPKILVESGAAARLDARQVPVAAAVRALFPDDWLNLALRGGEDYELLFTAPAHAWEDISNAVEEAGGIVTAIGEIVAAGDDPGKIEITGLDGATRTIVPGAFDHFARE